MSVSISDFFCGAGGSSSGLAQVPGVEIRIAANHWALAINVHNANHPETDHSEADLHLAHPSFFPRTDMAWMSPECTKWSQAGGSSPKPAIEEGLFEDPLSDDAATRSRLLMFDALRLVEHHRYRAIIVENVVDIASQAQYRLAWHEWQRQLRELGYSYRVVSLNSMHAQAGGLPAPQSRDRIYIVAWRKGERAPDLERVLRPRAYCPKCDAMVESRQAWKNGKTVGRYRQSYVYVHGECGTVVEPGWLPAAAAIDWSLPGTRIGDREASGLRPLAEKTLTRIAAGIARYWGPLHIEASGNQYDAADPKHARHGELDAYYRAWPMSEYLRVLHTQETKALVVPVEGRDGKEPRPTGWPLRTQTTRLESALVAEMYGTSTARSVSEPAGTFTAGGNHHGLIEDGRVPFMLERRFEYRDRGIEEPMATLTANDTSKALVTPSGGTWNEDALPIEEVLRTLTTREAYALVQANMHANRAHPASEPLPTSTTATGGGAALVHRMNDAGAGMTTPVEEYLRTLTTAGNQALLQHPGARRERPRVTDADLAAAREMLPEVLFRMFEPHEVAAGMAFPAEYRWDVADDRGRTPSKRDLTKMAGNAVTPPAARDLGTVVVEDVFGAAA